METMESFGRSLIVGDKVIYRSLSGRYFTKGVVSEIRERDDYLQQVRLTVIKSTISYPVRLNPGDKTNWIFPDNLTRVVKF